MLCSYFGPLPPTYPWAGSLWFWLLHLYSWCFYNWNCQQWNGQGAFYCTIPFPGVWAPAESLGNLGVFLSLAFSVLSALHTFCLCLSPCSGENNGMANINVPHPLFQNVYCFRYASGDREEMVSRDCPQGLLPYRTNQGRSSVCPGKSQMAWAHPASIGQASSGGSWSISMTSAGLCWIGIKLSFIIKFPLDPRTISEVNVFSSL